MRAPLCAGSSSAAALVFGSGWLRIKGALAAGEFRFA